MAKFRIDKSPDGDRLKDRYFVMEDGEERSKRTWVEITEAQFSHLQYKEKHELLKKQRAYKPEIKKKEEFIKFEPTEEEKKAVIEPEIKTKKIVEIKKPGPKPVSKPKTKKTTKKRGRPKGSKNKPKGKSKWQV